MTFQVGDKVKLIGSRKGEVTYVGPAGHVCVELNGIEWTFASDEAKAALKLVRPDEPAKGSVFVDCDGAAFIRGEDGWYMGAAEHDTASFAWQWKDLYNACGPLTVVYNYVDTSLSEDE